MTLRGAAWDAAALYRAKRGEPRIARQKDLRVNSMKFDITSQASTTSAIVAAELFVDYEPSGKWARMRLARVPSGTLNLERKPVSVRIRRVGSEAPARGEAERACRSGAVCRDQLMEI